MTFINEDFLLHSDSAKRLYGYVKDLPIIDYHCHISPQEIYCDKHFDSITEIWLGGDHYKWRMIRSNGVPEREITGDADDYTKFLRFAEALPKAIGNPMYHWTHLELKRYFGYDGILNADTAREVYELCNSELGSNGLSARQIIRDSNVKLIGTTDDPTDTLEWHEKIRAEEGFDTLVCPSFRPDKAVNIEKDGFREYIHRLAEVSGVDITSASGVKEALGIRLDFFIENGCVATDHGIDYMVYSPAQESEVEAIFQKVMNGDKPTVSEAEKYKTAILLYLGEKYAEKGIVMQLHYGVQRSANSRLFRSIGADTGFDCILTKDNSRELAGFLNALDNIEKLPKTIIYSLNPHDNESIDTIIGSFQGTEAAGKIQHGAAWWFSDSKVGMETHMRSLASLSLLGNFVGMLTDSRSFLSYTRHEYFRRILCGVIGDWVTNGEYLDDEKALRSIVEGISYGNAARYFGVE